MHRTCQHAFRPDCEAMEGRQLLSYFIHNVASGKALDVPGGSTANGVPIIQHQPHQGLNQQWELIRLSNGNYLIINDASGKALDDPGGSRPTESQSSSINCTGHLTSSGGWSICPPALWSAINYRFNIINVASGKALDDPGGSRADGVQIIQYQPHQGLNQQWIIDELGARHIQSTIRR